MLYLTTNAMNFFIATGNVTNISDFFYDYIAGFQLKIWDKVTIFWLVYAQNLI